MDGVGSHSYQPRMVGVSSLGNPGWSESAHSGDDHRSARRHPAATSGLLGYEHLANTAQPTGYVDGAGTVGVGSEQAGRRLRQTVSGALDPNLVHVPS